MFLNSKTFNKTIGLTDISLVAGPENQHPDRNHSDPDFSYPDNNNPGNHKDVKYNSGGNTNNNNSA